MMSLETVSNSFQASNSFCMAGDPWCPNHGMNPCACGSLGGSLDYTVSDFTIVTQTCISCGSPLTMGSYHVCNPAPIVSSGTGVPWPFTLPATTECAICDKVLEFGEKKLCKECRGVFDAWKFLTKKDEPEPEPE